MARRLVKLSRICSIDLDPAIADLAKTGLQPDSAFDEFLGPSERAAIQAIFDYDFRAVLPAAQAHTVAIAACRQADIRPVVVYTKHGKIWDKLAIKWGYTPGKDFHTFAPSETDLDADFVKEHRHGILLLDESGSGSMLRRYNFAGMIAQDFPRTMVLTESKPISQLKTAAEIISPCSPIDFLEITSLGMRRELEFGGFTTTKPEDLSMLLSIITELTSFHVNTDVVEEQDDAEINTEITNSANEYNWLDGDF